MLRAYDEIIDFLAAGTTPKDLMRFQPSEATKARVAELIEIEKERSLSADEAAELNRCMELEHLMRLAKARARRHLQRGK